MNYSDVYYYFTIISKLWYVNIQDHYFIIYFQGYCYTILSHHYGSRYSIILGECDRCSNRMVCIRAMEYACVHILKTHLYISSTLMVSLRSTTCIIYMKLHTCSNNVYVCICVLCG